MSLALAAVGGTLLPSGAGPQLGELLKLLLSSSSGQSAWFVESPKEEGFQLPAKPSPPSRTADGGSQLRRQAQGRVNRRLLSGEVRSGAGTGVHGGSAKHDAVRAGEESRVGARKGGQRRGGGADAGPPLTAPTGGGGGPGGAEIDSGAGGGRVWNAASGAPGGAAVPGEGCGG